jgi:hypothetical protein
MASKWQHEFVQYYGKSCTPEVGAELLLQSWTELSNLVVAADWDYGEEISSDQDFESSDEDFELRMATDPDDEDTAMVQTEIWDEEKQKEGDCW